MAIPQCFENYIGIRGHCDTDPPLSGLYIDDLEGITVATASKIADGSVYGTGVEYLKAKIHQGIMLSLDEFKQYAAPLYTIRTVLNMSTPGQFNTTYLASTLADRGVKITKRKAHYCSGCSGSNGDPIDMQRMFISKVTVLVNTSIANKEIFIEDGANTTTINTGPLVAGIPKQVAVNYRAENAEIFMYMNNVDVDVNQGAVNSYYYNNCATCGYYKHNDPNLLVQGFDGVNNTNFLYGLNPEVKIDCSEEMLWCALADKLKYVLWYRAGIEVVKGWLASDRINMATMYNTDIAKMLLETWTAEYQTKYTYLQNSIREFLNQFDGSCINCRGMKMQYTY